MGKILFIGMCLIMAVLLCGSVLQANEMACGSGGECHWGKAREGRWDMEDKFAHKVGFFMANRSELGLSDDQVKKIKDLGLKTKKTMIKMDADIDTVMIDIEAAMHEDPMDAAAVKALIGKKYELKKQKAESLIDALAALKGILTPDQKTKMKEIWKRGMK